MDISNTVNMTSADSSLTGTEAKKMAALARFKAMEADVTPRTAINQFVAANQSEAQTPALFFGTEEDTEPRRSSKRRRLGDKTSLSAVAMEETNLNEDTTGNLSSDISDTMEASRTLRRSARGRGKKSPGVTMEDVDPDRDITKPTNLSATVNMTDMQLTDDSLEETMQNLRNKKRVKAKKTPFTADDFNLTVATADANKSATVNDTLAQLDKSDNESMILQEKMSKRRQMLERKKTRQQAAKNWDFSGIEPPSPKQKSQNAICQLSPEKVKGTNKIAAEQKTDDDSCGNSVLEFSSFEETRVSRRKSSMKQVKIDKGDFSNITTMSNKDVSNTLENEKTPLPLISDVDSQDYDTSSNVTLNANSNEGSEQNGTSDANDIDREVPFRAKNAQKNCENATENISVRGSDLDTRNETPEGTPHKLSSKRKKIQVGTSDFDDITATDYDDAIPVQAVVPPITNNPSPGSRKLTNAQNSAQSNTEAEETIENISRFVNGSPSNIKSRRKSVFESGLPQDPIDNTMVLEQTQVFHPGVESTRLANMSEMSRTINATVASALGVASPETTDTGAKPGRDTSTPYDFNKSSREPLRGRGLSKTTAVLATIPSEDRAEERANKTVTDFIDPQLPTPQIIEVIRDARKSGMRSMRLSTHNKTFGHPEDVHEAECQVTPGIDATNPPPKVIGDMSLPVGHTSGSQEQLSSRNATIAGFSVSNEESSERAEKRRSAVNEIINSLNHSLREKAEDLMNSLTEEVDIDLKENEGHLENIEKELDITSSGRRNPSPVIERRNEVDINVSAVSYTENEDGEEGEIIENAKQKRTESRVENYFGEEDELGQVDNSDDEGNNDRDQSLDYLRLPDASQVKSVPNSQERKEMRQATLAKYLGVNDETTLSPLITPQVSPKKTKEQMPKSKTTKRPKAKEKSLIPAKNIKFEYQRFSRYKLKPDAEKTLIGASDEFLNKAMKRMSSFAAERGAEKIHMCDIKRMMVECGFVKPAEEDPTGREFTCELREIARDSQIKELIPMNKGAGKIYPPRDLWEVKGGKKKSKRLDAVPSSSSVGGGKKQKADKVRRLKVGGGDNHVRMSDNMYNNVC